MLATFATRFAIILFLFNRCQQFFAELFLFPFASNNRENAPHFFAISYKWGADFMVTFSYSDALCQYQFIPFKLRTSRSNSSHYHLLER